MVSLVLASVLLSSHPALRLTGLDGRPHDPLAEAGGRPVALVFIAHDCPVCNSYAPEFGRISTDYGRKVFFGLVYSEPSLSAADAKRHAQTYGLSGAHLFLDPSGRGATACGAGITPEAAIFDANGRRTYLGRIDDLYYDFGKQRAKATRHDFRDALDATLAHRLSKPASGPPFGCVIETTIP
jgi:thiol-disulfide isomerase/thioredoxin